MAIQDIKTLKDNFRNDKEPPEGAFWNWMDSYWHKYSKIPLTQIENINGDAGVLSPIVDIDFFGDNKLRAVTQGQAIKVGIIWTNIISSITGENVNYEVVNIWKDGSSMDDTKVDGVIYRKRGNEYLKLVYDTYVNVKWFGAKGDGATDDTKAINAAILHGDAVHMPPGTYRVTDTIKVSQRRKSLIGGTSNTRGYNEVTTKIVYDGVVNNLKAVIQLGQNAVGQSNVDSSNLYVSNIQIDGNNKAGFCMYGTYLTNEAQIVNVVATNSTQHNFYFAKSWYASFRNITSLKCKGMGISFGVPLRLMTGEVLDIGGSLEMNNTMIENIRSHSAGTYFSEENPNTFKPENHYNMAYGIGLGMGYSFNVNTFTSEQSGGANVYVYSGYEDIKSIRNGYLEGSCVNSGLDPDTTMANMVVEHTLETLEGSTYVISDVFFSHHSGGIYFKGEKNTRPVKFVNVRQPRFLRSMSGLSYYELHRVVQKENCYYGMGYYNSDEIYSSVAAYKTVNTRYSFLVEVAPHPGAYCAIFVKAKDKKIVPFGSLSYTLYGGNIGSASFPDLSDGGWHHAITIYDLATVEKGGNAGSTDNFVEVRVMYFPLTTK